MPAEQIADGVFWIRLGLVNAYLIWRGGRAVLIDTGLPRHAPIIRAVLAELGVGVGRLQTILLTHRHLDHVGGAEALRLHFGVPVRVHRADAAAVLGAERLSPARPGLAGGIVEPLVAISDRWVFGFRPCLQVEPFEQHDSRRIDVLDGVVAVHLPGHTPGQCGYIDLETCVLFGGDVAVQSREGLKRPSAMFTVDAAAAVSSMQQLTDLGVEIYCFGHGRPTKTPTFAPSNGDREPHACW